ncbi:tetratricopeptide repeat protein [Pseudoalteromonas sp. T1lg75]|uniref:tetratricopeptide repeat protein n=1 Tax=Pseudoalteromonas sp. T1lg75 TaxID=2077102 RepID=UPI000CF6760D|nr:hypothetical protein [Pseudoalteromonas sp. T1lg75]
MHHFLLSLIALCLATACVSNPVQESKLQPKAPSLNASLFIKEDVEPRASLFSLTPSQIKSFNEYRNKANANGLRDEIIVYNYVENLLSSFSYDGTTFTAKESLLHQEGNCISLALVVQAYADLAGVETGYQLMKEEPVFAGQANVVLLSSHFRTKLYAPKEETPNAFTFRSSLIIDYFPSNSGIVSGGATIDDLIAKYYANHAAQALLSDDINTGFNYIQEALLYKPRSLELLNIAAVLHRRAGDLTTAQEMYDFILDSDPNNAIAISNYVVVAKQLQDQELVAKLEKQLRVISPEDPYHLLHLAHTSAQLGNFTLASQYILRARKIAPYLPRTYVDMALLNYQLGKTHVALNEMQHAIDITRASQDKTRYQAKYEALKRLHKH